MRTKELNKYLKEKKDKEIKSDRGRSIHKELGIELNGKPDITNKTRLFVKEGPKNVLEMIEKKPKQDASLRVSKESIIKHE